MNDKRAFEQGTPTIHNAVVAYFLDLPGTNLEHRVVMIVHHRIGADVDAKEREKQTNSIDDPLSTMFTTLTGVVIDSTQKSTVYAA